MSEAMYYRETRKRVVSPEYDSVLVWLIVLLLGLGVVMVYSSSIAIAEAGRGTGYQPTYYLVRHALFVLVGELDAKVRHPKTEGASKRGKQAQSIDPSRETSAAVRPSPITA